MNPYGAPKVAVAETAQTQPIRLLSVSGRIGRVRYVAYGIFLYALLLVASGLVSAALTPLGPTGAMVGSLVPVAIMIVLSFMLTIQRCHDFNASGWLSILGLVPLVNLIFWFIPGTDGPNRFGPPPPPNGAMVYVGLVATPVVVVGALAAITVPVYQDRLHRAQVSGVIIHGSLWRSAVEQHYHQTKKLPSSATELRSPPPAEDNYGKVSLTENGVIVLTMKGDRVADKTILLRPTAAGDSITWDCTGGTLHAKFRPASCR